LQRFVDKRLYTINDILASIDTKIEITDELIDGLIQLVVASDYVIGQFKNFPNIFIDLVKSGDFDTCYLAKHYDEKLADLLEDIHSEKDLLKALRLFRKREWLRLVWRDVLKKAPLDETLADMSNLADACIRQTVVLLQDWLEKRFGTPVGPAGKDQKLHVIAMGKLGGRELNLSSDIDLVFYYLESGFVKNGPKKLSNQDFFIKLSHQIINTLSKVTGYGFVFRVDMRLRPYGNSGPLVTSINTLKEYVNEHADEWERYAYVKARLVNEDKESSAALKNILHEFVYDQRSNIKILSGLKRIKSRLMLDDESKESLLNIKIGYGGIRHVEFIVQLFQLINGCSNEILRVTNVLQAIQLLIEQQYLQPKIGKKLEKAYRFLRRAENRLQAMADQQIHTLPTKLLLRSRLSKSLGYRSWSMMRHRLEHHRGFVEESFEQLVNIPFRQFLRYPKSITQLFNYQYQSDINRAITYWIVKLKKDFPEVDAGIYSLLSKKVREDLRRRPCALDFFERIKFLFLEIFSKQKHELLRDPVFIRKAVLLCVRSTWVVREIVYDINILIELLEAKKISLPEDRLSMKRRLDSYLIQFDRNDQEAFLKALRLFKHEYIMRVAVADVLGQLSVMRVSDLLTDIAITVLRELLSVSWGIMVKQYGYPKKLNGETSKNEFAIIGYGKLGGIELSYQSDLDLVFIHDIDDNAKTTGENSISGLQFYIRMAQQMIKFLNVQTSTGRLYEVDTRLKPQGDSGILVTSFKAYENYQKTDAWTWEHQALVRARVVAGNKTLGENFAYLREDVLKKEIDLDKLRLDIVEMREKIRAEHKSEAERFDLQHDKGGITDIEFISQYIVLAWSRLQPMLLVFPDNIRILETAESGSLLPRKMVDTLCHAYRLFRKERHRLMLLDEEGSVPRKRFSKTRNDVKKIWHYLFS